MLCTLLASVAMAPAPALLRLPVKLTILFEEILEDIHPTPSRTRYRIGTYEKDKLTVRKTITVDFLGGWSNGRLSPDGKEILVRASEWHHKPGTLYIIDVQQAKARLLDEARSYAWAKWSTTGKYVLAGSGGQTPTLHLLNRKGGTEWSSAARTVVFVPGSDKVVLSATDQFVPPFVRTFRLATPGSKLLQRIEESRVDALLGGAYRAGLREWERRNQLAYQDSEWGGSTMIEPRTKTVCVSEVAPDADHTLPDGTPGPNDHRYAPSEEAIVSAKGKVRTVKSGSYEPFQPLFWSRDGRWVLGLRLGFVSFTDSKTLKTGWLNFDKYGRLADVREAP